MIETYTVIGYWADSNERYKAQFDAPTAREAERLMQRQAADEDGDFRIAATMLGTHESADRYTSFVDPDDPANEDDCEVRFVSEDDEVGEWTVIGIVLSTRRLDREWNERTGGERWISHELATHPRYAEDIARAKVAERGHFELLVCAVFRGVKNRCESLVFSNPGERAAA